MLGGLTGLGRAALRWLIRVRLGPYRVVVNRVDPARPERTADERRRVLVIGGGLAGIAAASTLAGRGYGVTLREAKPYLGGKIGSWQVELSPGVNQWVSHGFHGFFRHYYNLDRFLLSLGLRQRFVAVSDYRILLPGGEELSFGELERAPVLNLLSMARHGIFKLRDVLKAPARDLMGVFLEYDPQTTFGRLDHVSFAEFDRRAQLPRNLKMAFNTFARAFFADESKLSMAELVKSFHFYYLSHDGGLIYDHPVQDYEVSLLAPIRAHLASLGVELRLGSPVRALERVSRGFTVDGERYDRVVLAADVAGVRALLDASAPRLSGLDPRLTQLVPGQRYAVLRIWLDRAPREGLPTFVITDRLRLLDAITFYDRTEQESAEWVRARGGSVLELHCYAVPDDLADGEVRRSLLAEMEDFLPELRGAQVRHEHLQLRRDFTAFHVGLHAKRPTTDSGIEGLYCAGDWVKLPFPAMLLEAAFASGLVAANRVLELDGLREEPVLSVPLRGLLAGMPQSPGRRRLLPQAVGT